MAVNLIRSAISVCPANAEYHSNLGLALSAQGRMDEAIAAYRQAIQLQPSNAAARNNLGVALAAQGNFDDAILAYRRATELQPDYADVHCNLGLTLSARGGTDEAISCYREALRCQPDHVGACNNLGIALTHLGQFGEAIATLRRAVQLQPGYADAWCNLGAALMHQGEPEEAITAYRHALHIQPGHALAHNNLGVALSHQGFFDEAKAEYEQAVRIRPDYAEAYNNLGNALSRKSRPGEAIAAYRRALQIRPNHAEAHDNLGTALKDCGRLEEAIVSYRQALQFKPNDATTHSNLILALHYLPKITAQEISAEQLEWNSRHAQPLANSLSPHGNDRSVDRRLRVGYVSADFRDHVAGRTLLPCFEAHDSEKFDRICYSGTPPSDAIGERFRRSATEWREIAALSDERLAAIIREDRIDVLVDLSLHTAGNRLCAFARKPAPVQISWLGYPGGTGLDAMDWRITDSFLEPAGADIPAGRERPLRLAECWCCYAPPENTPAPGELPVGKNGHITFASFNNFAKINDRVLHLWAGILKKVENSRLLMLSKGGEQDRVRQIMECSGVAAERVGFLAFYPMDARRRDEHPTPEYLHRYQRTDIALDPFPYNGMTTTCDALWMGVPVIALVGKMSIGRASFSLLSNAGLGELCAASEDDYVRIAAGLARNLPRLAALRATMRERLAKSPLLDAVRFTRNLEHAYCTAWRHWCASGT